MASESTDEPVSVSLPPELAEWIDEQASASDSDRETVLLELLAAHRAADVGDELDAESLAAAVDMEGVVRNVLADQLSEIAAAVAEHLDVDEQVSATLDAELDDDRVETAVESVLDDRLSAVSETAAEAASDRVAADLDDRFDAVEDDYMAKVQDVRDRVIQVKKEADAKAAADHDHPDIAAELDDLAAEVDELSDGLEDLERELDRRQERLEEDVADAAATADDLEERIDDVDGKLQTVAHVVKDLRESDRLSNKRATSVDQLKTAAAELDVDRAACEACGEGVQLGLLTDPECPHCGTVVTDVEPKEGFFGSPRLVKARGIEPAEDDDE